MAGAAVAAELAGLAPDRAVWAFTAVRGVHAWARGACTARMLLPRGEADRREEELLLRAYEEVRAATAEEPLLLPPLAVLATAMRRPEEAAPEDVAWACLCVMEWALANGATETALAFAQAAALAQPDSARPAWVAGKVLRTHGRMREAESWLRRAVRVAVWAKDWEGAARALIGLGNLHLEQGAYERSRTLHSRALRISIRHDLEEQEAMALHDLFIVASITGHPKQAQLLSRRAFDAYGPAHERLPALAYDLAFHWSGEGYFARALSVLEALLPHFEEVCKRYQILTCIARAAGASGNRVLFCTATEGAWALLDQLGHEAPIAAGLFDIARGAASLRDWSQAKRALDTALRIASERGVMDVKLQVEAMMEMIRKGDTNEISPKGRTSHASVCAADALAADLVRSLNGQG